MPSNLASALYLAAGLLVCAAPALAQDERFVNDVDAKQRAACTPDVQRLCNQYIPDVQQIVGFLKAQQANLSPACADVFSVPMACKPDVTQLCANAPLPGLVACLKAQQANLSGDCATAFAEAEPKPAAPPAKKAAAKKAPPKK